ncbi:MAG: type III-B CRISPR-associated protein Cas10/Cmr2, partial [Planktothrix sp.]|uniref:type III-B CRISPR-associated protein Cas10/Cmr2 n=1 Tax=Planktothrix sp. TaxID=3088171 RepID=UPI0038D427E7
QERQPQQEVNPNQLREALSQNQPISEPLQSLVQQVEALLKMPFPEKINDLQNYTQQYPQLWSSQIGLVYGGATKIKQYVFEASKLPDIRGASALLDRINLIDFPAFFGAETSDNFPECQTAKTFCQEIRKDLTKNNSQVSELWEALIPELIIYSTGGNILAFCPAAFIDDLANLIEKRYTSETLTANSCAVGAIFKPLEVRFGLLKDEIKQTFWLEEYQKNQNKELVKAYFTQEDTDPIKAFEKRKSFNELVTHLAIKFNQRRSGHDTENRPSRRYPPMFETHPFLVRDESDRRLAIGQAKTDPNDPTKGLPGDPWLSETLARKRLVGQITKRYEESKTWYEDLGLTWEYGDGINSWVYKFAKFAYQTPQKYYDGLKFNEVKEARSLREIADASEPKGFVAYIYADGNNMGGYIQKSILTPQEYKKFSQDIFEATEQSVYKAILQHLKPHKYKPDFNSSRRSKKEVWIHPFEIVTIGGDDVLIIVPANKALEIAKTIGEEFEKELLNKGETYRETKKTYKPERIHRYQGNNLPSGSNQCQLSMSTGVLITAENTPIYYAEDLVNQLLKSAKGKAKTLKKQGQYLGGTIDFFTMKSVTMLASSIKEFREQGLTKEVRGQKLQLYAAPYTLYEIGGLLESLKALHEAKFPRSQLYQIRSFLEQGKQTAILNYLYFRTRLNPEAQRPLKQNFEETWCKAKTNDGNIVPWMFDQQEKVYETIWRDLVDLYAFYDPSETSQVVEMLHSTSLQDNG